MEEESNTSKIKNLTPVQRTKVIIGKSVPAFIHNGPFQYVNLDVYEDGVVECWELTDLDLFKKKLKTGWVKTAVPNGETISIHGLGHWVINNGIWNFNADNFHEYITSIVKELNPEMVNLYVFQEMVFHGVKIGQSAKGNVYKENRKFARDPFPEKIFGERLPVFYKSGNKYYLVQLVVFPDGKIQIQNLETSIELSIERINELAGNNLILTEIPENSQVEIFGLGNFTIEKTNFVIDVKDKILELKDVIEKLNNRPDSVAICRGIYNRYVDNPTIQLKEELKSAYEKIPRHNRMYIGDMDEKDIPIRMIIYGDQEIEKWSHYIIAKKNNMQLPTITIPKPKE